MKVREIRAEIRYGWEPYVAICDAHARGEWENCDADQKEAILKRSHDISRRIEQVARFDALDQEEQRFLRHVVNNDWNNDWDSSLFAEVEAEITGIPELSELRSSLSYLLDDMPYHRKDPKAAMMALKDVCTSVESSTSAPEPGQASREKLRQHIEELRSSYLT